MGLPDEGERKNTKENKEMKRDIYEKIYKLAFAEANRIHGVLLAGGAYVAYDCKIKDDYADVIRSYIDLPSEYYSDWRTGMVYDCAVHDVLAGVAEDSSDWVDLMA